ncbi:MAG: MltA domain-containing protein [Thermodesulfobacteriota bacterium]|nr:MltA domain-containing protein [Thermodesulfobacteriota bacterium]
MLKTLMGAVRSFASLTGRKKRLSNPFAALWPAYLVAVSCLLLLTACAPKIRPPVAIPETLVKIRPDEFPDFSDDMSYSSLKRAVDGSLNYVKRLQPSTSFCFGPDTYTASHLCASMEAFLELAGQDLSPSSFGEAMEKSFSVYRAGGRDGSGQTLFTGYYEPTLKGSLQPSPHYPYPVYRKPDDWVRVDLGLFNPEYKNRSIVGRYINQTVIPYFTREDIDAKGRLLNKGGELLWVSDQIDLFFLHIQGSGRVLLENGKVLHINYECSNGRPYRSIGRLLIDEGSISRQDMSMQQIAAHLRSHPRDMERVFNHNQRYIFFRIVDQGPLGAIEVPLTPGRSVATDPQLFPKAGLAYIQTQKPLVSEDGTIRSWQTFGRFVLNQDTGEAIRGPSRVDLFWGSGSAAETAAGHMKREGTLYFVILKKSDGT